MMMDFDRPQECIELIEQALSVNRDFVVRWPHVWYWMAEAHKRLKDYDFITAAGAVSFGISMDLLGQSKSSEDWPNLDKLKDIFMIMLERIISYVALSARILSKGLSRYLKVEFISERVAKIILFTPLVVGEEWIRQFGSLCGRLAIPEHVQGEIIEAFSDRDIFGEMIEPTITELNAVAKIFPEEEGKAADEPCL